MRFFVIALATAAVAVPAVAAEPALLADSYAPLIQYLASAVAAVVVGLIGSGVYRLFGVHLEARHREALHSALSTGASLALASVAEMLAKGFGPDQAKQIATDQALDYVRRSVPGALRVLGPTDDLLRDLLKAKQVQIGGVPPTRLASVRG